MDKKLLVKYPASLAHRLLIILAMFAGVTQLANAQAKAYATLKPERIETGDTTSLTVIVSGVKTEPRDVDFVSWKEVFPLSNIRSTAGWRQSGTQWIRQYTLIAFDSATLELPPLTVLMAIGKPLNTNALKLSVFPTPGADISDMEPIRDIYREPVSWMDYWLWALGGLVLLVLCIWYFKRKVKKPLPVAQVIQPPAPRVSASETALQKLNALQSQQLWKKGQEKEHHAQLSMIVREYLESNFNVAALESTSSEIIALLNSSSFSANLIPLLRDVLNKTDMVKFAQSQLPEATHEIVLEKARELITPTYLRKQAPPKSPPEKMPLPKPKSGNYEPL